MHLTMSRKGVANAVGEKSSAAGMRNYLKSFERELVRDLSPGNNEREYLSPTGLRTGSGPTGLAFVDVVGRAAEELGYDKKGITNRQWDDHYEGMHKGKRTGRLGNRKKVDKETGEIKNERVHNPGFDIPFFTPKSVSTVYALAPEQKQADDIDAAMLIAAKFAFKHAVEDYARAARKWVVEDGKRVQKDFTADWIATPVVQHTARPTNETIERGAPPSPHLHVHCFAFSSVLLDGEWYTANDSALKRTAEYRGELYSAELARQLELLGYEIEYKDFDSSRKGKVDWEVKGANKDLMELWSDNSRRAKALEAKFLEDKGRPPRPWEINDEMKITRCKKGDKAFDSMPTRSRWTDDADRHGYDITPVMPGPAIVKDGDWRYEELCNRLFARNGEVNEKGFIGKYAQFNGDRIKPAIARASVGLGILPEERDHFEAKVREQLVVLKPAAEDRNVLYTTPQQLELERDNREWLDEMATDLSEAVDENAQLYRIIDMVIARQDLKASEEQRQAVIGACTRSKCEIVVGLAGTGKSLVAKITREVLEEAGFVDQVLACSVSAKTGTDMGKKINADKMGSVESLLHAIRKGKLRVNDKTLIVIDEAAMLDSWRLKKLRKALKGTGCRIAMFGDPEQISPIFAAGWFTEHTGVHGYSMLTEVHRQRNALDVQDYAKLREGKGQEALASLDKRGRIHITADRAHRFADVLKDYKSFRAEGYGAEDVCQIIGTTNDDVDKIGQAIQNYRKVLGEVSGNGFHIRESGSANPRSWRLYEGDQVIFLRTYSSGATVARNGSKGTLVSLDEKSGVAKVNLGSEEIEVRLLHDELVPFLGQGYAVTAMRYQGDQVKIAQVVSGPDQMTSSNTIYSQVTRAEHEAHVYLSSEDFAPLYSDPEYIRHHEEFMEGVSSDARSKTIEFLGRSWSKRDDVRTALSHFDNEETERKRRVGQGIGRSI